MSLPILLGLSGGGPTGSAAVVQGSQTVTATGDSHLTDHGTAAIVQRAQSVGLVGSVGAGTGTGSLTNPDDRTYGRINQVNGFGGSWVKVATDANGFNDQVHL